MANTQPSNTQQPASDSPFLTGQGSQKVRLEELGFKIYHGQGDLICTKYCLRILEREMQMINFWGGKYPHIISLSAMDCVIRWFMKQKQRGLELSALAKVYPENVACPIPEKQRRQNKGALFHFGTHHAVGNPSPSREPWWSDFVKVHVTHLGMETPCMANSYLFGCSGDENSGAAWNASLPMDQKEVNYPIPLFSWEFARSSLRKTLQFV